MRFMKKRILALVLAMVTSLSLVACGGNSTEKSTENANAGKAETEQVEDDGTTYFSEFFTTDKNRICYELWNDEGGKNSEIRKVYVFQDGKAWMYPLRDLQIDIRMGDVAQMTDEEILTLLDEKLQEVLDKEIEACNKVLSMNIYSDFYYHEDRWETLCTGMDVVKAGIEKYKGTLENFDAKVNFAISDIVYEVYTDDTGNYVDYEIVRWTQKNCEASTIGYMQYVLDYAQDEARVRRYLLDWYEGPIYYTTDSGDDFGNIIEYEVYLNDRTENIDRKISYAHRSALYSGDQEIYDSSYGGYYLDGTYRVLISRNIAEDNLYEIDTKDTADFVDPK